MNKEEFLSELQECLYGEVDGQVIQDSISYYGTYIEEQKRDGKTEQQVLEELGDANFIAKSIIEANEAGHEDFFYKEEEVVEDGYQDPYSDMEREERRENLQKTTANIMNWVGFILVMVLVLVVVGFLFKAFLPIILILFVIGFIRKIFESR